MSPCTWDSISMAASLIANFYPNVWNRIRSVEDHLNIGAYDGLHVQMVGEKWDSGNPKQNLSNEWFAAYDDHQYVFLPNPPLRSESDSFAGSASTQHVPTTSRPRAPTTEAATTPPSSVSGVWASAIPLEGKLDCRKE